MGYKERRVKMFAARAEPHLEPGEQVQTGLIAQTGPVRRPFLSAMGRVKPWTIIVTDRAILVLEGLRGGLVARGPRDVFFGDPTGLHHKIVLDQEYWVHRDYYKEIIAADEALRGMRSDQG